MARAYYSAPAHTLTQAEPRAILGCLVACSPFDVTGTQTNAWIKEITILRTLAVQCKDAHFFLEFSIPRMGRRADAVILWRGVIFVVEFKVGAEFHSQHAEDQVLGYALDLKNFHETSHQRRIVPIVVATAAPPTDARIAWDPDNIAIPVRTNADALITVLSQFTLEEDPPLDPLAWENGRYKPTPTIIEAAQTLYRTHSVEEISRNEAGARNLSDTATYLGAVIDEAKKGTVDSPRKAICFVTGVPGSGKTLAGLHVANLRMQGHDDEHAVFLSGNGPLVVVLREALTQDSIKRARAQNARTSRPDEFVKASAFIQNIHHFRDEALQTNDPMVGKVVVFDEAQRAWNTEQLSKFMRQKRGQQGFAQSEPAFLLDVMDRHRDWCVVICLVGGGQEINTGEGGIAEWLQALRTRSPRWTVHMPRQICGDEYLPNGGAHRLTACEQVIDAPALHLSVSIRSFRAERLSEFVGAVIAGNSIAANELIASLNEYPIAVTRDLPQARHWLRQRRRGKERAGLLASSNGLRLKSHGVFVRAKVDPAQWFLAPRDDVRSSDALEDAATEFEVQGLELDWACVCWDANLRQGPHGWESFRFFGTRWQQIRDEARKSFLLNSYRVLLTRARQGMVIYIPPGDAEDITRAPKFYDDIATFLYQCGIPKILDDAH